MPQSLVSLTTHIVFSTRDRQPLIDDVLAPRLYGYIGGIVHSTRSVLLAVGGIEDHIHLLVSLGRTTSIADPATSKATPRPGSTKRFRTGPHSPGNRATAHSRSAGP